VAPEVRAYLYEVARQQARYGVRLFLFGSVARTWPQAHIGADLDIGYEIDRTRNDLDVRRRSLERDIEGLPSIRPVDLVDISEVSDAFLAQAVKHVVELSHEPSATATA
jgi:predicted nucleotidyltransferase